MLLSTDVAREIYGPAATYVERAEPASIAEALERALFDEPSGRERSGRRRRSSALFVARVRAANAAGPGRRKAEIMPRLSIIIVTYNSRGEIDDACGR